MREERPPKYPFTKEVADGAVLVYNPEDSPLLDDELLEWMRELQATDRSLFY